MEDETASEGSGNAPSLAAWREWMAAHREDWQDSTPYGLFAAGWDAATGHAHAQPFDHERYRARALEIHAATCSDPGRCNYGEEEPAELADDESLPWPERQRRAGARLGQMRHCMAAVEAENRVARESR